MAKVKRKKIIGEIEIPEGIKIELDGREIKINKNGEELKRSLSYPAVSKDGKIIISCDNPSKKDKKLINTSISHIKNMLRGLQKKFVYKLQIASVHFPMSVSVSGQEVIIKNFLGERKERRAKILDKVEVKIEGEIITVKGSDKEKVGQTAANMETATKIRKRDRRIFQDGCFIISKEKGHKKNE